MSRYILAIDQGTTSSRAIIFNQSGKAVSQAQQEFRQIFPADGWVEHDPEEIWNSTLSVCKEALSRVGLTAEQVDCMGITNQRETTVVWNRHTGAPVYNAIVWQDRRTSERCKTLKAENLEATFSHKTGLLLDPYFSGTKIEWILNHVEGARSQAEHGDLLFGTIDCFLLWRLTGGKSHKTDATNASRTLIFNIHQQGWDTELLNILNIPNTMLPEVCDCSDDFGRCDPKLLGADIAITGIAGDQQAALFGQACFQPGMVKSTYGTGCFMVLNTGNKAIKSKHKLLTTVGYRINGKVSYALEGSIFIAGAAIQWLRDGLKLISDASETEALAAQANPHAGVYLVPAFTGLGAPYWDPDARGGLFGLTRDTSIADIVTAGLQSVAYQTKDLLLAMKVDGAIELSRLRVDGGMVNNLWFMQFLADILDVQVERPPTAETTALGVAYLAGMKVGIFDSTEQISELWHCQQSICPQMDKERRDKLYDGWLTAVNRIKTN